jgi:hypothetical protein
MVWLGLRGSPQWVDFSGKAAKRQSHRKKRMALMGYAVVVQFACHPEQAFFAQ